jgi:hypothetical protein
MRMWSFFRSFVICWMSLFAVHGVGAESVAAELPSGQRSEAKADTAEESVEIREFEVRVDNKSAGTHRLTIASDGDSCKVGFQTDVKMDFLIYAYVFKFRGTEVWRDGRLENVDIHCEDRGKKRTFALKTDGEVQQVSFNGKEVPTESPCLMTTAYWQLPRAEVLKKSFPIADVDNGQTRPATLNVVGKATISTSSRTLECRHFKIEGPSPAELWFDDQDRLVRQKSVEAGHQVELKLKEIRIVKTNP